MNIPERVPTGTLFRWLAILALFVAVRVALLVARDPFFDELFTTWIVRRSFGGILDALRHDSGPPLYYFLLKILGAKTVVAARIVSLACATIAAALLLATEKLGPRRYLAVLLLAVDPVSTLFAVDARAYALAAMFVAIGVVALVHERPFAAALAFVAAAYSHYYGVFFFATLPRWRAAALAGLLFLPGFLLARVQPAEAMQWNASLQSPLDGLPFAGRYPEALLKAAPWLVVIVALVLVLLSLSREHLRFVLIPFALAFAFSLVRTVYFPMRFESIVAVPLVLCLSRARWRVTAIALAVIGFCVVAAGIADHLQRPPSPYRTAALSLRGTNARVVATGYLYLETVSALGDRVEAFPPQQATHPGWRAMLSREELRRAAAAMPRAPFVWIGERGAPELPVLCESFVCRPRFVGDRVLLVSMTPR